MIYLKRILFGLAWLLYRGILALIAIPAIIIGFVVVLPIYYIKNGTIYGYKDKLDNYGQSIWDWIDIFDPDWL